MLLYFIPNLIPVIKMKYVWQVVFDDPTHTARVNCLAWTPDSSHMASGSLDNSLIVWKPISGFENKIVIRGEKHTSSEVVWGSV